MDLEKRLQEIADLRKVIDSQNTLFKERLDAYKEANKIIEECRKYLGEVELEIEELRPKD
jgi:predicted  nucleic acid-binding Zn-ribbon protein